MNRSVLGLLGTLLAATLMVMATSPRVWGAGPLAGKLGMVEGQVGVLSEGASAWSKAQPGQDLYVGDAVQTGQDSRAAILGVDECQIKLNANTILVLKQVAPSPRFRGVVPAAAAPTESVYELPRGEVWVSNKNEKFRGRLETPAVSISPRGTEMAVKVGPNGATTVILLEGRVCLANVAGELCLRPGEEGVTIPGKLPSKRLLAKPADAVQWVLYYPGIFSYRDLPLSTAQSDRTPAGGPAAAGLHLGEQEYDRGNLSAAQQAAEAALRLDPGNRRALRLLGWVHLQRQAPAEAEAVFRRVAEPDAMTVIGLALARYRQGDLTGAYQHCKSGWAKLRPSSLLTAMTGFFAMLVGKAEEAKSLFDQAAGQAPPTPLPSAFLAQMALVQGRQSEAQAAAAQALRLAPSSPLAQVTMGLVQLAAFKPEQARVNLEKARDLDPRFVDAYILLARLWLGSDFLDRAQNAIRQAMRLAPEDGEVLSLAGFVRLAFRDFDGARRYFQEAIRREPNFGEPHMGLAIWEFRHRRLNEGLNEMLQATLLDPRISRYQSQLGKALYQVRAFDKALETYDYAKTLDPRDPTPYLYKGIALSDLNRPGEAIQEINKSIELNDNVALFRNRQGLDRDLAVRNYNLARSYDQLGLRDWAYSKAITAVKRDPYNAAAHLFLSKSYANTAQGPYATTVPQITEETKFRILSPSNENTFESQRNDNYTPMFEMPYARVLALGTIGGWRESDLVQDYTLEAYAGRPGLGGFARVGYTQDHGFKDGNDHLKSFNTWSFVKWDPSVKTSFQGQVQYLDTKGGDIFGTNDYRLRPDPTLNFTQRLRYYDVSVVHRFNPQATFLAYYTYQNWDHFHITWPLLPSLLFKQNTNREFHNLQLQQNLVWGRHNFIGGGYWLTGREYFNQSLAFEGTPIPDFSQNQSHPNRAYSLYLFDYWRPHPQLLLEAGVIYDSAKSSEAGLPDTRSNSQWNPILGVNWYINPKHTLRLGYQRHMMTFASWLALTLVPTETAGLPWPVFVSTGTDMRNVGLSWEAEWGPRTFSLLRLEANRFSSPTFDDLNQPIWQTWETYRGSFTLNRILLPSLGLAAGVVGQRVVPDLSFGEAFQDFSELKSFLQLSYLHPKGWQAGVRATLLQQWLKNRADNLFCLVDLRVGKELANKRGQVSLEVTNLFNRHFYYALEPTYFNQDLFPARQVLFKLALYY